MALGIKEEQFLREEVKPAIRNRIPAMGLAIADLEKTVAKLEKTVAEFGRAVEQAPKKAATPKKA